MDFTLAAAAELVNSLRDTETPANPNAIPNGHSESSGGDKSEAKPEEKPEVNGIDVADVEIEDVGSDEGAVVKSGAIADDAAKDADASAAKDASSTPKSARPRRGAILAPLEFLRQAKENGFLGEAKSLVDSADNLVRQHFVHFGDKASFFSDVKNWLPLLDAEEMKSLVRELAPSVGAANLLNPTAEDAAAAGSKTPETVSAHGQIVTQRKHQTQFRGIVWSCIDGYSLKYMSPQPQWRVASGEWLG